MVEATFAARKPLKKKRAKKRKDARPRCAVRGCTKPAVVLIPPPSAPLVDALCKPHAKKEADRLAREIVLNRDGHKCVRCGSTQVVQWAHVIRRGSLSVRWLEDGAVALCSACHVFFTHREEEWRTWLDANRPGLWERLNAIRIEAADKRTQPDLAEIIASLRSQAASL